MNGCTGFSAVVIALACASAFAGTTPKEAKSLDNLRAIGLDRAVIAHVANTEPRACDAPDVALQDVTATRLSAGGMVDYEGGGLDDKGRTIPRVYWETYDAYYLVVHECVSGSTKAGSWVTPARAAIWKVSYRQRRDVGAVKPRQFPRSPLGFERVRDVSLPKMAGD